MFSIGFVHRVEQPGHPSDPRLDGREPKFGKRSSTPEAHRLATGSIVGDNEWVT